MKIKKLLNGLFLSALAVLPLQSNAVATLPATDSVQMYASGNDLVSQASDTSGNLVHGQSFVITGSGFGTKATPEPLVYDDFESGTVSSAIAGQVPVERAIGGSWTWAKHPDTGATYEPVYSNTVLRPNSTRSALMHFEGSQYNNSLEIMHALPNTGDEVYFTFWEYYDLTSTNYSRNRKPWVVYGNTGYNPSAYIGAGDPGASDGWYRNSVQDDGINDTILWGDISVSGLEAEWVRHEFHLKQSGNNVANGVWHHTVHRTNTPSIAVNENEQSYITRSSTDYWTQWHFGSYQDNESTNAVADVYIDNLYFDSTPMRVELCDTATWSACTKRAIQVAKSWADTSITITVNSGMFNPGDLVYLYVIDASNAVINTAGFAVTVGTP